MANVLTPHKTGCVKTTCSCEGSRLKKWDRQSCCRMPSGHLNTNPTLPQLHFRLCNMFPKVFCLFPSMHRGLIFIAENISWANWQKYLQPTLILKLQRHNGIWVWWMPFYLVENLLIITPVQDLQNTFYTWYDTIKYHQRWRWHRAINCLDSVNSVYTVYTAYKQFWKWVGLVLSEASGSTLPRCCGSQLATMAATSANGAKSGNQCQWWLKWQWCQTCQK